MLQVVAAAIRVGGIVWHLPPPARHCHLVHAWSQSHWHDGPTPIPAHEQGFWTSAGTFVGREEAARIAYRAKQLSCLKDHLYSEDLW